MGLFFNYVKVAWRSIEKNKQASFVGFLSLFLGFICSLMIVLVVNYETGYDSFHQNSDRLFRVVLEIEEDGGNIRHSANVGPPLGPEIRAQYPEVLNSVRFRYKSTTIVSTEDERTSFYEENIFYADPQVLQMFTFPLSKGNPKTALGHKNSIILSAEMAAKYFADSDPIGETLLLDGESFVVRGVLEPIPSNRHLKFDFLLPFDAFEVPFGYPVTLQTWGWTSFHTYVLLSKDVNIEAFQQKMPEFAQSHFDTERALRFTYRFQPIEEIYFGEFKHESVVAGDQSNVTILISVAILVLLLSAFNFANIQTARSLSRGKETSIRKTFGSGLNSLRIRFLAEPLMLSLGAMIFALMLLSPVASLLSDRFGFPNYWNPDFLISAIPLILGVGLFVGFLAGVYPAFIMSSIKLSSIIKSDFNKGKTGNLLRHGLMALQFCITAFLISGSFIVNSQIDFLQSKDLGFEKDQLVILRVPGDQLSSKFELLRSELLNHSRITNVSIGGGRLDGDQGNVPILAEGHEPINLNIMGATDGYFQTIGAKMVAGRDFSADHPTDSARGIIINEAALSVFDWEAEEAIGKKLAVSNIMEGNVVGVVSNFHFESLRETVKPIVAYYPRTLVQDVYVRISAGESMPVVDHMDKVWYDNFRNQPFDMVFLDRYLNQLYQNDRQFADLIRGFSWVTIFIAIIGLYCLIALICEQRMKEIGIRKVLGAGVFQVIYFFSKHFLGLILLANFVTWPLVFLSASKWMENFAYQTEISALYFFLTLTISFVLASITLYIQVGRFASLNPVRVLRSE